MTASRRLPGRETDLLGHRGACNCPVCFAYARQLFQTRSGGER